MQIVGLDIIEVPLNKALLLFFTICLFYTSTKMTDNSFIDMLMSCSFRWNGTVRFTFYVSFAED